MGIGSALPLRPGVIMFSALVGEVDRVVEVEFRADDYVTKPSMAAAGSRGQGLAKFVKSRHQARPSLCLGPGAAA